MERNLTITEKAHEALGQIQLLEAETLGYKRPLKVLASEAILEKRKPLAQAELAPQAATAKQGVGNV
jgi:hypothetical protein